MTELHDTRETVQNEARYLYFDEAIDRFHRGECSFEQAVAAYLTRLGVVALSQAVQPPLWDS